LFVVRTFASYVPPYMPNVLDEKNNQVKSQNSVAAAIEFAVKALKVKTIIVKIRHKF
jgi:carbonic anhydrase